MMKVTIYITTTLAGPGTRPGKYGAAVEYITKRGKPEVREVYGEESETTRHRSVLMAAIQGIKLLIHPCKVELVTDCIFIVNMLNKGYVETWSRNGWKKASGEEVKMKDLWKELYGLMSIHEITATFRRNHHYRKNLLENMIRRRKIRQDVNEKRDI